MLCWLPRTENEDSTPAPDDDSKSTEIVLVSRMSRDEIDASLSHSDVSDEVSRNGAATKMTERLKKSLLDLKDLVGCCFIISDDTDLSLLHMEAADDRIGFHAEVNALGETYNHLEHKKSDDTAFM